MKATESPSTSTLSCPGRIGPVTVEIDPGSPVPNTGGWALAVEVRVSRQAVPKAVPVISGAAPGRSRLSAPRRIGRST